MAEKKLIRYKFIHESLRTQAINNLKAEYPNLCTSIFKDLFYYLDVESTGIPTSDFRIHRIMSKCGGTKCQPRHASM